MLAGLNDTQKNEIREFIVGRGDLIFLKNIFWSLTFLCQIFWLEGENFDAKFRLVGPRDTACQGYTELC